MYDVHIINKAYLWELQTEVNKYISQGYTMRGDIQYFDKGSAFVILMVREGKKRL